MTQEEIRICTQCVMDTTDPLITFDENGVCNHCREFQTKISRIPDNPKQRREIVQDLINRIKNEGKDKEYDCIIGVSGGVDSTYVAYYVKGMGLRPLAIHVDNGWNSEFAVNNIKKCLKKLDIDLFTEVLNWNEFKGLQKAFLRASVPDGEIPTDHAIMATLYKQADLRNISYIITGGNIVTEAILPTSWSSGHRDWRYINGINKSFGDHHLTSFPHYSFFELFKYLFIKRLKVVNILDFIDFNKAEIMKILKKELDWTPYPAKHYESIYTRFFQGYVLPTKFGYDKRKAHLSTLINSGQITRIEALRVLSDPPLTGQMLEEDMDFVLKKFDFTQEEFEAIMALPKKSINDFPNNYSIFNFLLSIKAPVLLRKIGLIPKDR